MVETAERPASEPLTMKALLESGVHFGHQTRRWHPRMKQYIFTQRSGIHIIDLQQTLTLLERAAAWTVDCVAKGGDVLFVGTKKQAQEAIRAEATRCGMMFVNQRWLGGTLTNIQTIRPRIEYMIRLEEDQAKGRWSRLPKKEALKMEEELKRLQKYLGGMRGLTKPPAALFVVDIGKEAIAISEARKLSVPIVALVDTDGNPDLVDVPIPGNDDAIRSIRLVSGRIADAILEGKRRRTLSTEEAAKAEEQAQLTEVPAEAIAVKEEEFDENEDEETA